MWTHLIIIVLIKMGLDAEWELFAVAAGSFPDSKFSSFSFFFFSFSSFVHHLRFLHLFLSFWDWCPPLSLAETNIRHRLSFRFGFLSHSESYRSGGFLLCQQPLGPFAPSLGAGLDRSIYLLFCIASDSDGQGGAAFVLSGARTRLFRPVGT